MLKQTSTLQGEQLQGYKLESIMGISGMSPGSLLLIAIIVVLLFGTKKLRGLGEDLGEALRGFKRGLNEDDKENKKE